MQLTLVNEDGRLVAKDAETNETVPLELGETAIETLRADRSTPTRMMQVRNASAFPGETGGEQIRAALADLPARGGTVFVPAEGPDTVSGETGVWDVTETVRLSDGQYLVGAGPGWRIGHTGTTLKATGESPILELGGPFLNGVFDLRLDGNDTATACLDMGRERPENDFVARNVMVHGADGDGIRLRGARNIWIDQCWIEECGSEFGDGGIRTQGDTIRDSLWLTNLLFFGNIHDVVFGHDDSTTVQKVWIENMRSDTSEQHSIAQRGGAPIRDVWIVRPHISAPGVSGSGDWDAMNFAGSADSLSIVEPTIRGDGITRHAIHRESGTWTDCSVQGLTAVGLTGDSLADVTGVDNGTRTVVNGLGYNGSENPETGGDWNSHEREGLRVSWQDDETQMLSTCINGEWQNMGFIFR